MNDYLHLFAKNIGILGICMTFAAFALRLTGFIYVYTTQTMTILQGGMALMLVSCVIHLNFLLKK